MLAMLTLARYFRSVANQRATVRTQNVVSNRPSVNIGADTHGSGYPGGTTDALGIRGAFRTVTGLWTTASSNTTRLAVVSLKRRLVRPLFAPHRAALDDCSPGPTRSCCGDRRETQPGGLVYGDSAAPAALLTSAGP